MARFCRSRCGGASAGAGDLHSGRLKSDIDVGPYIARKHCCVKND